MFQHDQKERYLSTLRLAGDVIQDILLNINTGHIPDIGNTAERLQQLARQVSFNREKLEKGTFEIAVIGMEKAGKSSLINALIDNDALPHAQERCTFTNVELRADDRNEAVVTFYSEAEFNRIFQECLRFVDCPLSIEHFAAFTTSHLSHIPANANDPVKAKIVEDITDIVTGSREISRLLNRPPERVPNTSPELRRYITDPYAARAVKSIVMGSNRLTAMPKAVLCDVPGFNSPVRIHEEMAFERLQQADAVILSKELAVAPNLLGPELNLVKRGSVFETVPLRDKLFVFGNRLDMSSDPNNATRILSADCQKYSLAPANRIFAGSARAYLETQGIMAGDIARSALARWQLSDGITRLRQDLLAFYDNEWLPMVVTRVNACLEALKQEVAAIIDLLIRDLDTLTGSKAGNKLLLEMYTTVKQRITETLADLKCRLDADIMQDQYFTNTLKERIDTTLTVPDLSVVNRIVQNLDRTPGCTEAELIGSANYQIRDKLYTDYLFAFSTLVEVLADEKAAEVDKQIYEALAQAFVYDGLQLPSEAAAALNRLVADQTAKARCSQWTFAPLAERFTQDLLDILILRPLGSQDRYNKFLADREEFYSLAIFHNRTDHSRPNYQQPLVHMILAHEDECSEPANLAAATRTDSSDNAALLQTLLTATLPQFKGMQLLAQPKFDALVILLNKVTLSGRTKSRLEQFLADNRPRLSELSRDNVYEELRRFIESCTDTTPVSPAPVNADAYLQQLACKRKPAATRDELLKELTEDIHCLKTLIKDAAARAMMLEKPFLGAIAKKINFLRSDVMSASYQEFLSCYAHQLAPDKFAAIERQREAYHVRQTLLRRLQELNSQLSLL